MLAALSASRDRQRQLVADAGHELRTPLTSLRTNLDLLTQADRQGGLSEESRAELLDDVRFQIEELTTLIGDLTELARDEPAQFALEEIDLAEITERAVAAGAPPGQQPAVRPARRALVGHRRLRRTRARRHQPARQRRQVEPAARRGHRAAPATGRCWSPTRATASPRPTGRTCSTGSTARRSRARCPAPGSASRSCARWPSGTAGRSGSDSDEQGGAAFWLEIPGRVTASVPGVSQRRLKPAPTCS